MHAKSVVSFCIISQCILSEKKKFGTHPKRTPSKEGTSASSGPLESLTQPTHSRELLCPTSVGELDSMIIDVIEEQAARREVGTDGAISAGWLVVIGYSIGEPARVGAQRQPGQSRVGCEPALPVD